MRGNVASTWSSSGARPAPAYRTGVLTRTARAATWLVVAVGLGTVALRYPDLPETVPVHFGPGGTPDRFGHASSVLWLVGVWLVLQTAMSLLSRRPQVFTYPVAVTADNAQRLYREGERLMVWVGLAVALVFLGVVLAVTAPAGPGQLLIAGGVAGTLLVCVAGVVRAYRAGTRPSGNGQGR